jgi:hypothetical protein
MPRDAIGERLLLYGPGTAQLKACPVVGKASHQWFPTA